MDTEGCTTIKMMTEGFIKKLEPIYTRNEVMQLFYTLSQEYLGWPKTKVHLDPGYEIPEHIRTNFIAALERLSRSEPIEYITGKCTFNGNVYEVNSSVLIPRPETEELCNMIAADFLAEKYADLSILDIGTGSGCIAIDLSLKFPYARVTAIDQSEGALEVAERNAGRLGAKVSFIRKDILQPPAFDGLGPFDIIVSNPPYVTPEEKTEMKPNVLGFEPSGAIFIMDKDPLLFYRSIASRAVHKLKRPGWIYFEINERFGKEMTDLLKQEGFSKAEIIKDVFGKDRFSRAFLGNRLEDISYWYGDRE